MKDCEHEWEEAKLTPSNHIRWFCKKCGIYSYAGKVYDELPDKSKSVFLYGKNNKQ
jgi:hypothetical protein